jgi:hypothetical protein
MSTELEKLPRLIAQAIATLDRATSAAEVLEAKAQATAAYNAAKTAAQFSKAHESVLVACRQMQANALRIEVRANIRLADEYDAAVEDGKMAGHGASKGGRGNQYGKVHDENLTKQKLIDVGLSKRLMHEARKVRDAEKAKPGLISKTLDAILEAGDEPTRACIKRAIKPAKKSNKSDKVTSKPIRQRSAPKSSEKKDVILAVIATNPELSDKAVAEKVGGGVTERTVRREVEYEAIRQQAKAEPQIDRADLPLSAQEKFDAAVGRYQKMLDQKFERRVLDEIKKRIDEMILPHWKTLIEQSKKLYEHRRGAMDKQTFNKIRRALHPDSRNSISDSVLADAFDTFMQLEKFLLNEKESPTDFSGLPNSLDEWDKMRAAAATAKRSNSKGQMTK